MAILTSDILRKICPNLSTAKATEIADAFESITPGYKMYSADILQEAIAQFAHESGGFRIMSESLNYSAKRLMAVWPSRFPTLQSTVGFVFNEKALAFKVYGGRMGNKTPDDAFNNRGSGFGQLTGKEMGIAYGAWWSYQDTDELMRKCREEIWWAVDSACWMFAIKKNLIQAAIDDDFEKITKVINGGLIGYTERKIIYELCKKYIL